jgi:adenosylmethionine-8-amino-7-oxononanoate aminotransferase
MVSARVAEPFYAPGAPMFRHGATYAAHATCCAAALANLRIMEHEDLLGRARHMEGELLGALNSLTDHELVDSARGGVGMMAALELAPMARASAPDLIARVFKRARELGVIVRPLATALATSPPLTVKSEHLELLTHTLRAALDDVAEAIGAAPGAVAGAVN